MLSKKGHIIAQDQLTHYKLSLYTTARSLSKKITDFKKNLKINFKEI